jgi:hypothetical protein
MKAELMRQRLLDEAKQECPLEEETPAARTQNFNEGASTEKEGEEDRGGGCRSRTTCGGLSSRGSPGRRWQSKNGVLSGTRAHRHGQGSRPHGNLAGGRWIDDRLRAAGKQELPRRLGTKASARADTRSARVSERPRRLRQTLALLGGEKHVRP